MAQQKSEQFRLLFLDKRNRLIADEVQQQGTIDHTPVYTREVMKRALELGAAALILVHNHPSGDTEPSAADIAMTEERSEEHTSELQSLMRISYAVFCLKKKKTA